jgi:orotidine-5'-phosphate decarboxylase
MNDVQPSHAADRLLAAIEHKRSPVCVGLDPVLERLPDYGPQFRTAEYHKAALLHYCTKLLGAIAPHVPCVKIQSACFERYRVEGLDLMLHVLAEARRLGLQVILDAKRGDIGMTAEHYAVAAFGSPESKGPAVDWLTVNSYLGDDGITPFLRPGHGAFALVRTSNPGGDGVQNLQLVDGRTVAHAVAQMVAQVGSLDVGERGYSSLGAVVGATKPQDARQLRELMPNQIFLVPGYGAQGGTADDVLPCFKADATGAIVTASRSVIYAFKRDDPKWMESVADAAAKFADEIGRIVGMRR